MRTFQDYNINLKGKTSGQTKTVCPKCSIDRKKKNDPCLSVNIDDGVWSCHNCGWVDGLKAKTFEKPHKTYIKPKKVKYKEPENKLSNWFKERGISQTTLTNMKVGSGREWMPQTQKEENVIKFNYYKDGELINVKYRDGAKNFKLVKGAEKIFYNIDSIISTEDVTVEDCIIVEGEIDALSLYEMGVVNVISVPNGASNMKMEYLDSAKDIIDKMKYVYLALDSDEAGMKLEAELSRRIGMEKCMRVRYPEDCKDMNDVLVKHGADEIIKSLQNAEPYPIEGVLSVNDIHTDIQTLYKQGLRRGDTVGPRDLDNIFSWKKGSQLTVITGISTHGKSNWMEHQMIKLSVQHDWKWAVFSPEHFPISLHFSTFAEKLIGKRFGINKHYDRMSENDVATSEKFINNHMYWIRPDTESYSLDDILESAKNLVIQQGINGMLIDPWNKIAFNSGGKSETNYINDIMNKLNFFKQKYDIHICLIAHPTKIPKGDDGLQRIPSLDDIAGSGHFKNQADNGITVYRDFLEDTTKVFIQKVKFKHMGQMGKVEYKFNMENGRFDSIEKGQVQINNNAYING